MKLLTGVSATFRTLIFYIGEYLHLLPLHICSNSHVFVLGYLNYVRLLTCSQYNKYLQIFHFGVFVWLPKISKSVLMVYDIEKELYHSVRLKSLLSFHAGFSSGLDKIGIEAKLQGKWLFIFFQ